MDDRSMSSAIGFVHAAARWRTVRLLASFDVVEIRGPLHLVAAKEIAEPQLVPQSAQVVHDALNGDGRVWRALRHPGRKNAVVVDRCDRNRHERSQEWRHGRDDDGARRAVRASDSARRFLTPPERAYYRYLFRSRANLSMDQASRRKEVIAKAT